MLLRVTSVRFLLHYEDKRSNMVWLADDELRLEALKTGFRSRKRMFTVFFNTRGPVVVDIKPDKATISATYYTTSVRTRRRSRIQLHHDNAAAHKARITQTYLDFHKGLRRISYGAGRSKSKTYLDDNGIRLMEHPP